MPRPIHFEIQAEEPDRAIDFYTDVFGWKFTPLSGPMPYWLVTTGPDDTPGINGGLQLRVGPPPMRGQAVVAFVCTIDVPNLDASTKLIDRSGGLVIAPKNAVPGVGWLAYATDTEGNIIGLMQRDPTAV